MSERTSSSTKQWPLVHAGRDLMLARAQSQGSVYGLDQVQHNVMSKQVTFLSISGM